MNEKVEAMGRAVKGAIRDAVLSGRAFEDGYARRILGYHTAASDRVDFDHEESPMTGDTTWYVSTEGCLELEGEIGRLYLTTLDEEVVEKLR